jgi:hypothetical protein
MTIMFYGRVLATSTANSVVFDMAEGSSYGVKVYTQYSGGNTLRVQMLSHGGGEIASITSAQLGDTMNGVAIVADPATATTRIYSGTVASSSLTLRYTTAAGINDLSTSSATFTVLGSEVTSVTGRNTALGRILVYNRALSVAEINVNHNIMRGAYAS